MSCTIVGRMSIGSASHESRMPGFATQEGTYEPAGWLQSASVEAGHYAKVDARAPQ